MVTRDTCSALKQERIRYSDQLCVLAHHYQEDRIVEHADFVGDSLELARKIPDLKAKYVVMCGVYFMAESAAILAADKKSVYIPDINAGCLLSEMSPAVLVELVLQKMYIQGFKRVVPLSYVNTSATVKAVTGNYGGTVCTSANSSKMLDWALGQGDCVLFLPDRNLGQNTANQLKIPAKDQAVLNLDNLEIPKGKKVYIWPGYCDVHERMQTGHIQYFREKYPKASVIVHPECLPEVVQSADASGSTSQILDFVRAQEFGSRIVIGTEINMVKRVAQEYSGIKHIHPLLDMHCKDMAKIGPENFLGLLQNLQNAAPLFVDKQTQKSARLALERMLKVCS